MWVRIMKGLLMVVAFVGVSAMFTVVLRPLAQSSAATGDETAAAGPSQTAARAEPIEAAIPEPLGPPPLPEGPKIAILVTELGGDAELGVTAIDRLPAGFGLAFLPGQAATRPLAIGSASCSERVCKYVSIWVDAVSLTK